MRWLAATRLAAPRNPVRRVSVPFDRSSRTKRSKGVSPRRVDRARPAGCWPAFASALIFDSPRSAPLFPSIRSACRSRRRRISENTASGEHRKPGSRKDGGRAAASLGPFRKMARRGLRSEHESGDREQLALASGPPATDFFDQRPDLLRGLIRLVFLEVEVACASGESACEQVVLRDSLDRRDQGLDGIRW